MKREKDFVVLQKERFISEVSAVIDDVVTSLKSSADNMGFKDKSCVAETLLLMMFSAKLEDRIFSDDQTTENKDNESEVIL